MHRVALSVWGHLSGFTSNLAVVLSSTGAATLRTVSFSLLRFLRGLSRATTAKFGSNADADAAAGVFDISSYTTHETFESEPYRVLHYSCTHCRYSFPNPFLLRFHGGAFDYREGAKERAINTI